MPEGFQGKFTPSPEDKANALDGTFVKLGGTRDPGSQKAKEELLKRALEKGRKKPH